MATERIVGDTSQRNKYQDGAGRRLDDAPLKSDSELYIIYERIACNAAIRSSSGGWLINREARTLPRPRIPKAAI